jgi:hypothetical protein
LPDIHHFAATIFAVAGGGTKTDDHVWALQDADVTPAEATASPCSAPKAVSIDCSK